MKEQSNMMPKLLYVLKQHPLLNIKGMIEWVSAIVLYKFKIYLFDK